MADNNWQGQSRSNLQSSIEVRTIVINKFVVAHELDILMAIFKGTPFKKAKISNKS